MVEWLAFQKLHGNKLLASFTADVVNGANVGMILCRCGFGLALEAVEGGGVMRHFRREELQGDKAAQTRVFGLVNDPHPTTAELFQDAIVRDGAADQKNTSLNAMVEILRRDGNPLYSFNILSFAQKWIKRQI